MELLPPPGPQRRRQLMLLGLLVTVLVAYWVYQSGSGPASSGSIATSKATAAAQSSTMATPLPPALKLSALGAAGENVDTGRNPFRFGQPPPPPAPPPQVNVPPPQPVEPPKPPPPPWPPPIPLTLIALWEDVQTQTRGATLHDPKTGAVYQVYQGSIVDGRYKVVKIGLQSVEVSYLDGSGLKTLVKR
jgi:hypothetical protein